MPLQSSVPQIRVYADTSVYGGAFDDEFASASVRFFDEVRSGRFTLCIGAPVVEELQPAPERVLAHFQSLFPLAQPAGMSPEVLSLRDRYLAADIVGAGSATDALHVALATLNACELLVSWNYKHIVHRDKAPRYNAVNTLMGFPTIGIFTPAEVVLYEERL